MTIPALPPEFESVDPASGETVWRGRAATRAEVEAAVARARAAAAPWSRAGFAERESIVRRFAHVLDKNRAFLGEMISREAGKPAWEALTEVQSMVGKANLSIQAHAQRTGTLNAGNASTRFRPHGVVAVLGPFNFPGHLPNGHIVPALLAGNAVVFKPSEFTPGVAELTARLWLEAGLPPDVLSLVQGGRDTGAALAESQGIDGLFFTGSNRAGQWLAERFALTPGKILALEMGGNNPVVAWNVGAAPAAALIVVQSAFLTAGQRCTCARRLIVPSGAEGEAVLSELVKATERLRVGSFRDRPEPFMGPVISERAAAAVVAAQEAFERDGGRVLVRARKLKEGTGFVSPGIVDVTGVAKRSDEEIFGPLLQVVRVSSFDAAVSEANHTRYGLAAALISDDRELYARFLEEVRAGVINWNHQTTGASGAAPFGGIGLSGNHRPSGFFAADYCAYPVASIEHATLGMPASLPPGL